MENYIECPITPMIMSEPVIASDGHVYEKVAIVKWLTDSKQSPVTRERLDGRLYPAMAYRQMIEEFLQKNPEQKKNQFVPIKTCSEYKDKINQIMKGSNFEELMEYTKFNLEQLDQEAVYNFLKKCRNQHILEHFIDEQNKLDDQDCQGRTLIHLLCYLSTSEIIEYVLDKYTVDLEEADINGSRPLHFACQNRDFATIKLLVKNGAKVNVSNKWKITPLHYLFQGVKQVSDAEIDILLKYGASFKVEDNEGITPVGWAFRSQEMDILLHLIDRIKSMNIDIKKEEMGLLFKNPNLEISGIVEIIKYLTKV